MKKEKKQSNYLPMILIILDGWGITKPNQGNAVSLAKTPVMDSLVKKYPNTLLCASGKCVGLPPKQVGNSEAGHMNIGCGRIVEQDAVVISKSINDGTFFRNPAFIEAIRHVQENKSRLHLMGMISTGQSPHSDPDHMLALLTLARENKINEVYLHLFTDGRDSPKYAALKLVEALERDYLKHEKIATIMGRFYAMDRKKQWDRLMKAYNALVIGQARTARSPQAAITQAYNRGEDDEYIKPYVITHKSKPLPRISDGDAVIFYNLRSDRARQFSKIFVQNKFNQMNPGSSKRKQVFKNIKFIAMTDFGPDLDNILTAYPGRDIYHTLPRMLASYKQLYIAETEKYAHVTYFFNGGKADRVAGEDRIEIASPNVKSYDQTPAMSSKELTKVILDSIKNNKYDFTTLNFAAPDMVGHTGNIKAGIKCCEEVDKLVGKIIAAYLKAGGTILVTADHGNIEKMVDLDTGEIHAKHTTNPVPFIFVDKELKGNIKLRKDGVLGDIAPTVLELLKIKQVKEMTGKSLIK